MNEENNCAQQVDGDVEDYPKCNVTKEEVIRELRKKRLDKTTDQ